MLYTELNSCNFKPIFKFLETFCFIHQNSMKNIFVKHKVSLTKLKITPMV